MLMVVVFSVLYGPRKPNISPSDTEKLISDSAFLPLNVLVMCFNSIILLILKPRFSL